MSLFSSASDDAYYFSMDNPDSGFSRVSAFAFELDGAHWPTVEHYYQAKKFDNAEKQEKIRQLENPLAARKAGSRWFVKKRSDWKQIETTVMTRALYVKIGSHPEIRSELLATGDQMLVENSQFDYFWGCGRDKRGLNHYGKILMNVRNKLRENSED